MKRPLPVTVLGCLFIVAGLVGLAYHLSERPLEHRIVVVSYGQNSHRARCPTHEPHFKRRLMINQARKTLCLGQTARILIYM
jgi:hypothetical protein